MSTLPPPPPQTAVTISPEGLAPVLVQYSVTIIIEAILFLLVYIQLIGPIDRGF